MKNIFENSKFGDKFMTRDESMAIYIRRNILNSQRHCVVSEKNAQYEVCDNGMFNKHIVQDADIIAKYVDLIVCQCFWHGYYDYRIMCNDGTGHVRLTIYPDECIISDLYVDKKLWRQGIASQLLNKVDELLNGRKAIIEPSTEWQEKWYKSRGYFIYKQKPIDEEKLDELANEDAEKAYILKDSNYNLWYLVTETFKRGYRKAKENG